jgi:nucleoside-diphosphate-sugar epimerase
MSPPNHPTNTPRKVGITGGAGFLGINLTRHLLAKGVDVVSFDKAPFDYPELDRITAHTGDIRDGDAVRDSFTGCDAVVHAAAALPLYPAQEILSVDIDGTRTVIEATQSLGIKRFVHISSTAVYGVPDHHPLHEDDPLIGVGPYGNAKIEAERVVEGFRGDLTATILRPKSFIGPERLGVFALLFDWASTGHHFPIPGKGTNLYQYLDVEDLCEAIWLSLTAPEKTANDTYNIGAERFGTFAGDFQEVLDHAGFGKKVKSLPAMPAIWILRLLDKVKLSPLYPWVYETAVRDSFVSIDKAQNNLGFQPRFSNAESLIRNYDWYVANKMSFQGTSGVSHRVPWKQGALALAKVFFR